MRTRSEVGPDQVAKYSVLMALVQVEMTGLKAHRCRYWTSSALVFISYALQEKGWSASGGDRRRLREVNIIQYSAGVSLVSNRDVITT